MLDKKYDVLIIGSGFAGAVAADVFAREKNKKVLVVEKRSHIGGNCYDMYDENGILIHRYGPHIFHTNSGRVYEYLSKYTDWYDYSHEVTAKIGDKYVPVPFNLNTLKAVFPEEKAARMREKLIENYGYGSRVPILELMGNTDVEIKEIADFVYENIFLKYTMKQWGQKPEEVDKSVTARVPVLISEDNRYFQDKYQGMPLNGYTPIFEKMLSHENIDIMLNTDARELLRFDSDGIYVDGSIFEGYIIYTGAADMLFDCRYGRLPYRTLNFEFEYLECDEYQPSAVVNYTVSEDFTRITEYKKLTGQTAHGTVIMREYPAGYTGGEDEIPYYAILNEENLNLYEKYKQELGKYKNFYLLGRLAEYKYYNIDAIIEKALSFTENLE